MDGTGKMITPVSSECYYCLISVFMLRTAQLASLAEIMMDPFYRTIEGLFIIIQKEWVSFGHQFSSRCGKTTEHETSPVFLQFLDSLHQLIVQFPSEFEYSVHIVSLIAQLCYSGLFITFMGNCERERTSIIRSARNNEDLQESELSFTSVIIYLCSFYRLRLFVIYVFYVFKSVNVRCTFIFVCCYIRKWELAW